MRFHANAPSAAVDTSALEQRRRHFHWFHCRPRDARSRSQALHGPSTARQRYIAHHSLTFEAAHHSEINEAALRRRSHRSVRFPSRGRNQPCARGGAASPTRRGAAPHAAPRCAPACAQTPRKTAADRRAPPRRAAAR
eukprot:1733995-Pleurochrysis_carterae.AAC.5